MPSSFHPLLTDDPRADPFWYYLTRERGYRESEARWLAETYDLRWAVIGRYAWRLIFPVKDRHGNLLTWTARALSKSVEPKYRQPRDDEVVTPAPKSLYGLDQLWAASEPRALVICEGTMDAARLSVSGAPFGVWATCLFGLALSSEQRELLWELTDRFPRICLMLDATARSDSLRIRSELTPLSVSILTLPAGVKDPGELTAAQAAEVCLGLLDG